MRVLRTLLISTLLLSHLHAGFDTTQFQKFFDERSWNRKAWITYLVNHIDGYANASEKQGYIEGLLRSQLTGVELKEFILALPEGKAFLFPTLVVDFLNLSSPKQASSSFKDQLTLVELARFNSTQLSCDQCSQLSSAQFFTAIKNLEQAYANGPDKVIVNDIVEFRKLKAPREDIAQENFDQMRLFATSYVDKHLLNSVNRKDNLPVGSWTPSVLSQKIKESRLDVDDIMNIYRVYPDRFPELFRALTVSQLLDLHQRLGGSGLVNKGVFKEIANALEEAKSGNEPSERLTLSDFSRMKELHVDNGGRVFSRNLYTEALQVRLGLYFPEKKEAKENAALIKEVFKDEVFRERFLTKSSHKSFLLALSNPELTYPLCLKMLIPTDIMKRINEAIAYLPQDTLSDIFANPDFMKGLALHLPPEKHPDFYLNLMANTPNGPRFLSALEKHFKINSGLSEFVRALATRFEDLDSDPRGSFSPDYLKFRSHLRTASIYMQDLVPKSADRAHLSKTSSILKAMRSEANLNREMPRRNGREQFVRAVSAIPGAAHVVHICARLVSSIKPKVKIASTD